MQILTKYHALVQSFPLSAARLGMFKPGRYSGFDTMIAGTTGSGIPIKISHAGSVITPVDSTNEWGDPEGVVLTPHGAVIKCSDIIELDITAGSAAPAPGNPIPTVPGPAAGYERTDLVYMEFHWIADDLGFDPFVGIIEGASGGAIPALGNAKVQVIVGYIMVGSGATTLADLVYLPAKVPSLGGANIINNYPELGDVFAKLAGQNNFSKYQRIIPKDINVAISGGIITLDNDSNTYCLNFNNVADVEATGFIPEVNKVYGAGTRLLVYCYNVGPRSTWLYTENGFQPGFVFPVEGLLGSTSAEIRNHGVYEFILLPTRTWWCTDAITNVAYVLNIINSRVTELWADRITSTVKVNVPENSSATEGKFAQTYFTNVGVSDAFRLKYRINRAGDLEVSGQFFTHTANMGGNSIELLTLPTGFNPYRTMAFTVVRRRDSPTSYEVIPAYLGYDGKITIMFTGPLCPEATIFINLIISFSS